MASEKKRIGRPPKLPAHTPFVLRIPNDLYLRLARAARAGGVSLNDMILRKLGWKFPGQGL